MLDFLSNNWLYVASILAAVVVYFLFFRSGKKKYVIKIKNPQKDKVYLFQFHGSPPIGMNPSPPCLKLETFLRIANLPYEEVPGDHLGTAPKNKCPYIELNGQVVADSEMVIEHLKATFDSARIDSHLSTEEKAVSVAFTRMIDEHLYWCIVHFRWIYPDGAQILRESIFKKVPGLIRGLVFRYVQSLLTKQLHSAGMGRHSESEIVQFGASDLKALADYLGNKKFFFGDKPSSLDAAAFGCLYNIMRPKFNSALKDALLAHRNLVDYVNFMVERYYSDKQHK